MLHLRLARGRFFCARTSICGVLVREKSRDSRVFSGPSQRGGGAPEGLPHRTKEAACRKGRKPDSRVLGGALEAAKYERRWGGGAVSGVKELAAQGNLREAALIKWSELLDIKNRGTLPALAPWFELGKALQRSGWPRAPGFKSRYRRPSPKGTESGPRFRSKAPRGRPICTGGTKMSRLVN